MSNISWFIHTALLIPLFIDSRGIKRTIGEKNQILR